MRLFTIILIIAMPFALRSQTIKINAGSTISTTLPSAGLGIKTDAKNLLVGFIATAGIDYAETKWAFLSTNIGIVQKGRKDKVVYTDALGNNYREGIQYTRYNYASINTIINFKLSQRSLVPFFSIGPRLDYLLNQNDFYDPKKLAFAFGFNGGFGLIKRFNKMELGGRIDYLLSLNKHPNDRTGAIQLFYGYILK